MTEYDLGKVVGDDGEAGNGIASITKTGTSGLVDTYTITFDDGSTTTFTVTNGSDASVTIQTSWGSTTSDSKVPSEKLTKDTLDTKIAKSSTTGLVKNDGTIMTSGTGSTNYSAGNHTHSNYISTSSTSGLIKNDGTVDTNSYLTTGSASSTYQPKLVSGTNIKTVNNESLLGSGNITIQGGSSVDVVTSWEATLSDSKVPSEKLVKNTIDGLSIPTKTSDLTNDGDGTNVFVKNNDSRLTDARTPTSHTHGNLTNDGKVGSTANYFVYTTTGGAITSKQKIGNITTSGAIGSASGLPVITTTSGVLTTGSFGTGSGTFAEGNHTHSNYISTSSTTGLVKNDGSIDTTSYLSSLPSHNHDDRYYTESEMDTALSGKQATLVSGTNIKTINSQSLLGSGDITISGGSSNITKFEQSTFTTEEEINYDMGDNYYLNFTYTPSSNNYCGVIIGQYGNMDVLYRFIIDDNSIILNVRGSTAISVSNISSSANSIEFWREITSQTSTTTYVTVYLKVNGTQYSANASYTTSDVTNPNTLLGVWQDSVGMVTDLSVTIPIEELVLALETSKQDTLVSGTNIKTVNNESLLGSGNISISGGGSVDIVTAWESTPSDSKVASEKLVKDSLDSIENLIGNAITYINGSGS